jgi:hypothetical protein
MNQSGDGVSIEAISIQSLDHPVPVHNITVSKAHTYYVGTSKILVHNKMR